MIWIQVLLVLALVLLVAWFLRRQSSYQLSAWAKIFMVLFGFGALLAIVFPNSSNTVAHVVGVGRGADLLLYILTISFLFVVLSSYVNRKRDQRRIVALARKVALLEAEFKKKK